MSDTTAARAISDLSDYVDARLGIHFPESRWGELEAKIARACGPLGFGNASSCIAWILGSGKDRRGLEALAGCLSVGETYFFRESGSFQALSERVLPEIIRARGKEERELRIWSAGCSTGEEPYSVAMLVSETPGLDPRGVRILGTDLNPVFIEKAKSAVYSEWSFRGVDPGVRNRFFKPAGDQAWEVLPAIREMVSFSPLNLVEDAYPAILTNTMGVDLILCRNVLIYFSPERARRITGRLAEALIPDGWLIVSPVEVPLVDESLLRREFHAGTVLHRRGEGARPPAAGTTRAAPRPTRVTRNRALPVPTTTVPDASSPVSAARELYARADYAGVIRVLGASGTPSAAALQLLSRAHASLGELPEAGRRCLEAIAADPTDAASRYILALVRIEQRRTEEAIEALRQAIFLRADFAVAHFTLANQYWRGGKREDSERCLRNTFLVLQCFKPDDILAESEGMTAAKLIDMISTIRSERGGRWPSAT